jgi:DNA-binding NtrC family response regulator
MDEVHTLSLIAQRKFLRVLEQKSFRRVGDHKNQEIPVDFRLISAAKPEIRQLTREGHFLEDLFHRLGVLEISIPPLRERPEDIESLTRYFQDRFNAEQQRAKTPLEFKQFRISTIREMEKYDWKGNVRELDGAVYQMMANAKGDIINPADFDAYLKMQGTRSQSTDQGSIKDSTQKFELEKIIEALKSSRTQLEAAAKLGVDRWTLIRKMRRLGIDPKQYLQT